MRLIDSDDMKKHIEGNTDDIKTIREWVDAQPTIKSPRMRGRWISVYDIPHGIILHCSVCGLREPVPTAMTNYCPNCGADMRGTE